MPNTRPYYFHHEQELFDTFNRNKTAKKVYDGMTEGEKHLVHYMIDQVLKEKESKNPSKSKYHNAILNPYYFHDNLELLSSFDHPADYSNSNSTSAFLYGYPPHKVDPREVSVNSVEELFYFIEQLLHKYGIAHYSYCLGKSETEPARRMPEPVKFKFSGPCTIVFFDDGDKVIVRKTDDDDYDPEKAIAMALAKKAYGGKGKYYDHIKDGLHAYETYAVDELLKKGNILDAIREVTDRLNDIFGVNSNATANKEDEVNAENTTT